MRVETTTARRRSSSLRGKAGRGKDRMPRRRETLQDVGEGAGDHVLDRVARLAAGLAGLDPRTDRLADFLGQVELGVAEHRDDTLHDLLRFAGWRIRQDHGEAVLVQPAADVLDADEAGEVNDNASTDPSQAVAE